MNWLLGLPSFGGGGGGYSMGPARDPMEMRFPHPGEQVMPRFRGQGPLWRLWMQHQGQMPPNDVPTPWMGTPSPKPAPPYTVPTPWFGQPNKPLPPPQMVPTPNVGYPPNDMGIARRLPPSGGVIRK